MCGVSLYISKKNSYSEELKFSILDTNHRGPDNSDIFEDKKSNYFIGLGHNRLKIIDLSETANQPMKEEGAGVQIIFNGEIYNFIELRNFLIEKGYSFKSNSDTEVILKLYMEYGERCFSFLRGMFSIIIYDPKKDFIFMSRDTMGIKPLYYSLNDNEIFVSSEIRGIKPFINKLSIDINDVYEFFNNGFLYEPRTGFKEVKKLMPGQILSIDLSSFEIFFTEIDLLSTLQNGSSLEEKLKRSVISQSISDVPLGIFFSGGCDSSLIASHSRDTKLFFANYSSNRDSDVDKKYSKDISKYLSKDLITCNLEESSNPDELISQIKFVAKNSEELISDYTFWPTYKLSQSARESGFIVMLSGMGGDEIFAGYPRYLILKYHNILKKFRLFFKFFKSFKLFPKSLDKKFSRLVSYFYEPNWPISYSRLLGYFGRHELKHLFGDHEELLYINLSKKLSKISMSFGGDHGNKVKLAQHYDRYGFLPHNLMVTDKASMLASIEVRVPLLDEEIVSHGYSLESSKLIKLFKTKNPLKLLLANSLPNKLLSRPKTGFNPPIEELITNIGQERLYREFRELKGFINKEFAIEVLNRHFLNKENNSYKIWQILYFKYWVEEFG